MLKVKKGNNIAIYETCSKLTNSSGVSIVDYDLVITGWETDKTVEIEYFKWPVEKLNRILHKGHTISSVIRQKGESQNGCFKKTKHAKFSEKRTFLTIKGDAYHEVDQRSIRISWELSG